MSRCRVVTSWLLLVAFAFVFAGCATTPESQGQVPLEDAAIEMKVMQQLHRTPLLDRQPIQVEVQDGVATLTGTVSEPALAVHAFSVARSVPGVQAVQNNIRTR